MPSSPDPSGAVGLSVKERGAAVATFRYVHVALMEMLARWTPTTPEMEVKLLFGEHIWDMAQAADAFGKRANELRLPLQRSNRPVDAYVRLLEKVGAETATARRLGGFYDALLPGLAPRYDAYLARTDALMDAPTVRILERVRDAEARMMRQSQELRRTLPALGAAADPWLESLANQDRGIAELVAAAGG